MTHSYSAIPSSLPIQRSDLERILREAEHVTLDGESRKGALRRILSCLDLTSLQGSDTGSKVDALCRKGLCPGGDRDLPSVAAICVYSPLIPAARAVLSGSPVKLATVAGYFPSGMAPLNLKVEEAKHVIEQGADEVDIVISRNALLEGRAEEVFDEVAAIRDACRGHCLKVILETGELASIDMIRKASDIALYAGADFIKTSTGKIEPGATLEAACIMLQAVSDFERATGRRAGFKAAGGVATPDQAIAYYKLTCHVLGKDAPESHRLRIGASRLFEEIVAELSDSRNILQ